MEPVTILTAVLGFIILAGYLDYQKRKSSIPGPTPIPFLGNTLEAMKNFDRILDWHLENTLKYGETWTFTVIGQPRRIITANPLNVEHILKKNFENYEKGNEFKERLHDLLGHGIFNVDGQEWKVQRKIASNIFSVKNFRDNMCTVFVRHGKEVLELLENLKPGEAINMHDIFHRFTLDSIGDIAFGLEVGSIKDENVPFARAFDFAQFVIFLRATSPIWKLRKIFSPDEAKFRESLKVLEDYCYKAIKDRRANLAQREHSDLLSLFMSRKNDDGEDYSDVYLRDLMMNFVIAGRDTTANSLSWAFYVLATRPDIEELLIKEIDETFGSDDPDYQVKDMKYATAFCSETLRLYPSVPKDPKNAREADTLPDGTKVDADSWITYVPWTMGRLKSIWGEDALEFKPERWLDESQKPSPFKYPVFQAGPRTCLGQDMAYLEMKAMISQILQKYKLRLVPGQDIRYQNSITLPMKGAKMMMTVEKRTK